MATLKKLLLYPNGDKQRKGKGHISLYLLIAETTNLPVGWEVNAENMEENGSSEVTRSLRDIPPSHYIFKIEPFSRLSKARLDTEVQSYESDIFEASGYKCGDENRNGKGYISLYLVIAETSKLPLGWEVKVNFKLFVYNQIQDKYLTIQDTNGKVNRFHGITTEWGFPQLFSLRYCLYPKGSSAEKEKYLSLYLWLYNGEAFAPERKFYAHYNLCIRNQHNGKHKKFTG
ncbi:unnamed protein product [Camellia sinensis]